MKRWVLIGVMTALVVLAASLGVNIYLGGCRSLKTRIAERKLNESPGTMPSAAEDWPCWRGPRGDGITSENISGWKVQGWRMLWAADVGLGYSSPVAARGRVYLFSLNNRREALTAFDANSGRIVWNHEGDVGWVGNYPGTRAAPAIDGDRIYTYGGAGDLVCRDLATGAVQWSVNVLQASGSRNLGWGVSGSPLVVGELIYVQGGKGGPIALAVRKDSGSIAWKSQAQGLGGYAHPIVADVCGTKQLVVFGGDAAWGLQPTTGQTIWTVPWKTSYDVNASTPVYADGHLFITSAYDRGCMMLRLSADGATKLWENKQITARFQGAILDGGLLFANSEGTLKCLSWPDGSLKWSSREAKLGLGGSLVRAGDRLLMLSDRGKLILARADANGMELIGQTQLLDSSEVWATPLIYARRVYVKGSEELLCFEPAGTGN